MSHSLDFYREWLSAHGKRVTLEDLGRMITYEIRVKTRMVAYPDRHEVISVRAYPVSKKSRYYREIMGILGPDWSTDVLTCGDYTYSEIARQCGINDL